MRAAYRPRRATKRWTEGAPDYILDVFREYGMEGSTFYTVLLGGRFLDPALLRDRKVHELDVWAVATGTIFVEWTERKASERPAHRRIKWLDVPANVRVFVESHLSEVRN